MDRSPVSPAEQRQQAAPEQLTPPVPSRKWLLLGVMAAVFIGLLLLLLLPDPGTVGPPAPAGPEAQAAAQKAMGLTREQVLTAVDESALQVWWRHDKNGEQHEERIYRFPDGMVTISINLLRNRVVEAKAVGIRPGAPPPAPPAGQ